MLPKITSTSIFRDDLKEVESLMQAKNMKTRYEAVHYLVEFAKLHGGLS